MKKLKLAAIGCGNRTRTYLDLASRQPLRYEVVAAADPNPARVERIRALSGNPDFRTFRDDREILDQPQLADIMVIGTQDSFHKEPCLRSMEKGYDILLEKPIATTMEDVLTLEKRARELGRRVMVCHVLRYTPLYRKVKALLDSGILGTIHSLRATEGVEPFHQAHSFVRGHWAVTEKSSPMIIAKCCHDMDLIAWLMDRPCRAVSSFGSRSHFREDQAPADVPDYCVQGCPVGDTCTYNALRYLGDRRHWLRGVFDPYPDTDDRAIHQWLSSSPWGRCVYRCDNTAVDHQVVHLEFHDGATASFTLTAFDSGRNLEIYGTEGVLRAGHRTLMDSGNDIVIEHHFNKASSAYRVQTLKGGDSSHGGGDPGIIDALYTEMTADQPSAMSTTISNSVASHLIGFAAEASRLTGQVVALDDFMASHSPAS